MGFCILGIVGDCGTTTESKTNVTDQVNKVTEVITEKYYKAMTEMKSSTGNIQSITVKAGGDVIISDVNMLQNINITSDMVAQLNNTYDVSSLVDSTIDTAAQTALSANNSSLMSAQTTLSTAQYNLVTNVKTQLKNLISKEDIISCTSNIINSQTIAVETQGNVTIKSINMTITASVIAKCMINTIMNYMDKVKVDDSTVAAVKTETQATSTSPLTTVATSISSSIMYIVIGIVIVVGAIIGLLLFRKK